jgi:primase-polymerase (primpol)-like protein
MQKGLKGLTVILPRGLSFLATKNSWIIYRQEPKEGGKLNKVPCNRGGVNWNAHDPSIWLSYEEAQKAAAELNFKEALKAASDLSYRAVAYGLGFVLVEGSGIGCLDVDDALIENPVTRVKEWSPIAQEVRGILYGAGVEVSVSGRGLHIWFRFSNKLNHAITNKALGLELYTSGGRFIAITGQVLEGDANIDRTDVIKGVIARYFSSSATSTVAEMAWTEGAQADWNGPSDDNELIRIMLAGGQSAATVFGDKASFQDLWECNVPKLSAAFPDGKGGYDESAADMSLAGRLAWWTGNDCPRIEALMRRSALVRDKWDSHPTYLRDFTILKALRGPGDCYNRNHYIDGAERRRKQIEEDIRIGAGSREFPTSEVLKADAMINRHVYVIEGRRVLDISNPQNLFTLEEWKSAYKASKEIVELKEIDPYTGKPKTKVFESARVWEESSARKCVSTITFRPGYDQVTTDPDGKSAANTWRAPVRTVVPGDASMFSEHVDYLFGEDAPRFLDWLAHIEQFPGVLPHTGWVHVSPQHGTGRNWLSGILCRVWAGYVAASFDLTHALRSGFTGNLSRKLLAVVDEINEGGSAARWENAETLKRMVTEEHRTINPKYGHQIKEFNYCRWLMFSNHTSALPLTGEDRRFNVVRNEEPPKSGDYYRRLYGLRDDAGFIAAVAQTLRTRDVSRFDVGAPAVMNEAKKDMVVASRSETDDTLADLIETYTADVISNATLAGKLTGQVFGKLSRSYVHAMERVGIRPYGKLVKVAGSPVRVSILRRHEFWKNAEPEQIRIELAKVNTAAINDIFGKLAPPVVN